MNSTLRAHVSPVAHPLLWAVLLAALSGLLLLRAPALLSVLLAATVIIVSAVVDPFPSVITYFFLVTFMPRLRVVIGSAHIPLYIVDVCLAIAGLGILLRVLVGDWRWRRTPLDPLVTIFLVSIVPSCVLLVARYPQYAAESLYFLGRYFLHIGAFFVITQLVRDRSRAAAVLACILVGLSLSGIWAMLQALPPFQPIGIALTDAFNRLTDQRSLLSTSGEVLRAAAGFNFANDFGGCMAVLLPLLMFHRFTTQRSLFLSPAGLMILVAGLGLLVSFSRTAIAGLLVGLCVTSMIAARRGLFSSRAPLYLAALSAILFALVSFSDPVRDTVLQRAGGYLNPLQDTNFQGRVVGHLRFAQAALENPLMLLFGQNMRILDLEERSLVPKGTFKGFVSDSWLLIALDSGILAFVVYMLIYGRALRLVLLKVTSLRTRGPEGLALLGCLASLIVAFVTHLFDNYMAAMIFMKGIYFSTLGLCMCAVLDDAGGSQSGLVEAPPADASR